MPANPACPHCRRELPPQTLKLAASYFARLAKAGRPRSDAPRCPCRANTLARATVRKFDCCRKAGIISNPYPANSNT